MGWYFGLGERLFLGCPRSAACSGVCGWFASSWNLSLSGRFIINFGSGVEVVDVESGQ